MLTLHTPSEKHKINGSNDAKVKEKLKKMKNKIWNEMKKKLLQIYSLKENQQNH